MRPLIFAISSGILLAAGAAHAAPCANPAGDAGDQVYNTTYHVMQYCNGSHWVAMGSVMGQGDNLGSHAASDELDMTGHPIRNLAPPSAHTDAATKHYVDNVVAGLLPVCTAAGQTLVWSGTAWACDGDNPPAPGPTQQCLKTVISSETFSAHMVNAALDGAPSLNIHYVMIGGGGGAGTGVACTTYPSSYGTGGGGGGSSAIVKDGTAIDVANGGKGGGYSACSGLDGQSKSGSFILSQSDTLAFYVGGGGGGAGYFAGRGGGGGAGWYGGGGGSGNGTNAGGGNGGGTSGGAGGTAGGTAGSAGSQFTGGTGSATYGGKGGDQGNGGIEGAGHGGGGGGYGGGGGGWSSSNDNPGGSNGGNAPDTSRGGQGAINWADHNNMTLPSAAGKGGDGATRGQGGNGGLIIYSYEHTNCDL